MVDQLCKACEPVRHPKKKRGCRSVDIRKKEGKSSLPDGGKPKTQKEGEMEGSESGKEDLRASLRFPWEGERDVS